MLPDHTEIRRALVRVRDRGPVRDIGLGHVRGRCRVRDRGPVSGYRVRDI